MSEEEEFPFNNQYYDLIKGKTISKRGVWWTALLLVNSKPADDTNEKDSDKKKSDKKKEPAKKVIIQRWRRFKQGKDSFRWNKSKDFTISSKNQWNDIKNTLNEWDEDGSWD